MNRKIRTSLLLLVIIILASPITLAQEIGVKSPDFGTEGQEFKNIGEYVVAIVKQILPIIIGGAVLVLLWAGFKYITSQGNPDATNQAKSLIEGVVLGLLTLFLVGLFIAFLTG